MNRVAHPGEATRGVSLHINPRSFSGASLLSGLRRARHAELLPSHKTPARRPSSVTQGATSPASTPRACIGTGGAADQRRKPLSQGRLLSPKGLRELNTCLPGLWSHNNAISGLILWMRPSTNTHAIPAGAVRFCTPGNAPVSPRSDRKRGLSSRGSAQNDHPIRTPV